MSERLHGGCFDCGSTAEATLESRTVSIEVTRGGVKIPKLESVALCSPCRGKRGCQ